MASVSSQQQDENFHLPSSLRRRNGIAKRLTYFFFALVFLSHFYLYAPSGLYSGRTMTVTPPDDTDSYYSPIIMSNAQSSVIQDWTI